MKKPDVAAAGIFLRKNLQLAKIAAVTLLVLAMSAWTSCSSLDVMRQARSETDDAIAIRETATRFSRQFLPATTAESEEWSRTTAQAAEFGSPFETRLTLAGSVSRLAEESGFSEVKVSFVGPDSAGSVEELILGDMSFQQAPYGLKLEGVASISAVSRLVLRLPPPVAITVLTLSGETDQLRATFQLAVYQPVGGAQN